MSTESPQARSGSQRRNVPAALAGVALLVAASVLWFGSGEAPPEASVAVVAESPPELPLLQQPVAAASAPKTVIAVETVGIAEEVQVCGGRWVVLAPDGKPDEAALEAAMLKAIDQVGAAAVATMLASPSPRSRAAAHYFLAGRSTFARDGGGCADEACKRLLDGWRAAAEGQRDALARIAQTTDDPQIYAWAYRTCRGAPAGRPDACQQVQAAQWARLDPDNAEPWLAVANEASVRKDAAALDDAMFHIAAATRNHSRWGALAAALVDRAAQADADLIGVQRVIVQAMGIESVDATGFVSLSGYCDARSLVEPNRRETCDRVATMLTDRSTTMLARDIGISMGRRLGWPADRLLSLSQQRDAGQQASLLRGSASTSDPLSCEALRAEIGNAREIAEFGEIEKVRRDVAASGKSVAQLAAGMRERTALAAGAAAIGMAAASAVTSAASEPASKR